MIIHPNTPIPNPAQLVETIKKGFNLSPVDSKIVEVFCTAIRNNAELFVKASNQNEQLAIGNKINNNLVPFLLKCTTFKIVSNGIEIIPHGLIAFYNCTKYLGNEIVKDLHRDLCNYLETPGNIAKEYIDVRSMPKLLDI